MGDCDDSRGMTDRVGTGVVRCPRRGGAGPPRGAQGASLPNIRRAIAVIITSAATAASLVSIGAPATAATAPAEPVGSTSPCQDVVYIGAEGSGQTADDHHGFGPEVWYGMQAYTDALPPGYHVGYFPVPYPSADVSVLLSKKTRSTFFDSIDAGVSETIKFLTAREPLCRDAGERYVLSGYSQGAMVMHRVLWQLAEARKKQADLASKVLPRIDGLLLIADGDRVSDEGGIHYGSAPISHQGIWWLGSAVGATKAKYKPVNEPVPTLPGWDPSRFHSVCEDGDVVCDASPFSLNVTGASIHGNAYKPSGYGVGGTWDAASDIARYTRFIKPLPVDPTPPPTGQVPVRVGQRGEATLADDGGFVSSLQWLTDPIPGATIYPGDYTIPAVLQYTPQTTGTWPFAIRVISTDGTVKDVKGSFVAYAIPDPSLAVRNVNARYDTTTYPMTGSAVDFDIVKTTASDTTPAKHFTTREAGADDGFDFTGGDSNGNAKLDLGETWHYAGIAPWWDDTTLTMSRTIIIKANDSTGAGAWQEATLPFTVTR